MTLTTLRVSQGGDGSQDSKRAIADFDRYLERMRTGEPDTTKEGKPVDRAERNQMMENIGVTVGKPPTVKVDTKE